MPSKGRTYYRWPKGNPRGGQFRSKKGGALAGGAALGAGAVAARRSGLDRALARNLRRRGITKETVSRTASRAGKRAYLKTRKLDRALGKTYRGPSGSESSYVRGGLRVAKKLALSRGGAVVGGVATLAAVRQFLPAARRQRQHEELIKHHRGVRIGWQKNQMIFAKNGDVVAPGDTVRVGHSRSKATYLGAEWRPHGANPTTTGRMVVEGKGGPRSVRYSAIKSRSGSRGDPSALAMQRARDVSDRTISRHAKTPSAVRTSLSRKFRRGTKVRRFLEREAQNEARNLKRSSSLTSQVAGRGLERATSFAKSKDFNRKYTKHTRPKSRYTHAKRRVSEGRARTGDSKLIRNYEKRHRQEGGRVVITRQGVRLEESFNPNQPRVPKGSPRGGQFAPKTIKAIKSGSGIVGSAVRNEVRRARKYGTVGVGEIVGGTLGGVAGSSVGTVAGTAAGTPVGGAAGFVLGASMGYDAGAIVGRQFDKLPGLNRFKVTQGQADILSIGLGASRLGGAATAKAEQIGFRGLRAAGKKIGSKTLTVASERGSVAAAAKFRAGMLKHGFGLRDKNAAQRGALKALSRRAKLNSKLVAQRGSLARQAGRAAFPNLTREIGSRGERRLSKKYAEAAKRSSKTKQGSYKHGRGKIAREVRKETIEKYGGGKLTGKDGALARMAREKKAARGK